MFSDGRINAREEVADCQVLVRGLPVQFVRFRTDAVSNRYTGAQGME
jgi:hypothetical protein